MVLISVFSIQLFKIIVWSKSSLWLGQDRTLQKCDGFNMIYLHLLSPGYPRYVLAASWTVSTWWSSVAWGAAWGFIHISVYSTGSHRAYQQGCGSTAGKHVWLHTGNGREMILLYYLWNFVGLLIISSYIEWDYLKSFFQLLSELAYDMLSPGPSVRQTKRQKHRQQRSRHSQPTDLREGVSNAYNVICEVSQLLGWLLGFYAESTTEAVVLIDASDTDWW